MALLDKKTSGDLVRLLVFIVVTTMLTGLLIVLIGNLNFASTRDYKAVFTNATGVVKGDDVRVAGVKVGTVKDVEITERTRALVSFTVADATQVNGGTFATIRYRNLVGQRYISLTQEVGDAAPDPRGRHDPGRADQAGPGPHRPVQRLQAALPGAVPGRHQQALLRDRPGLPGRGRHARGPAASTRPRSPARSPTATRSSAT